MVLPTAIAYRLYLLRKATNSAPFVVAVGGGIALSLLTALHDLFLPAFGLVITATLLNLALEPVVLRFPTELRDDFRAWFARYQTLHTLIPPGSSINLRDSALHPDAIWNDLNQMVRDELSPQAFQEYARTVERAFSEMEQDLQQARRTREEWKLAEKKQRVQKGTQKVARDASNYQQAMKAIYSEETEHPEETQQTNKL